MKKPRESQHPRLFCASCRPEIQLQVAQNKTCIQCALWYGRTEPLCSFNLLYVSERNSISEPQLFTTTVTRSSPTVAFVELSPSPQLKNEAPEEKEQKKPEDEMSGKVELVTSQKVRWPEAVAPAVLAAPRCCRCCRGTTSQRGFIFSPIFFPVFKMYTFRKQIYYMFIGKKKISVCRKLSV